jgi:hypothetical protein
VEPGPIYNQPSSGKERKGASESSTEHRRRGKPRGDHRDDAYERMIGEIERRNATLMEFLGQRDASQAEQMEEFLERTANMITDVTEKAMEHFIECQEVTMSRFMDAQVEALERQRHDNERASNQIEELCGLMKELVARETVIPSPCDMTVQGDRDDRYRTKVKIGKMSVSSGSEKETRNDSTERERGPRKMHTLNASRQSYLRLASAPPENQTEEWQWDRPPHMTRSPTQVPVPGKTSTSKRAPKVVSQLGISGAVTHTGGTLLNRDEEFWARPGGMNAHQERLTNDYRQIIRDVLASTPDPNSRKRVETLVLYNAVGLGMATSAPLKNGSEPTPGHLSSREKLSPSRNANNWESWRRCYQEKRKNGSTTMSIERKISGRSRTQQ